LPFGGQPLSEEAPVPANRSLRLGVPTLLFLATLASAPAAQDAPSEETIEYFRLNCASCHTIGGGALVGPDLKGVLERAERDWLIEFVLDPSGVIDSGDPYALKLLQEARGVPMQPIAGITRDRAEKLLDLIAVESAKEKSLFAGLQLSDRALTAADVALGRALFTGETSLANGAPACVSCHSAADLGGFGGGRLGPDLTAAYSRLEGRKALGAWLAAPPSPVMQPLFADRPLVNDADNEEVLAMVAFLEECARSGEPESPPLTVEFVLAGLGGAAALMVVLDVFWRRRFRAVRRPLVARS
jgi:mono/diheme cytochrome c family protein